MIKGIVFGSTFERAEKKMLDIRANYALCHIPIIKEIKQKNLHQITYENGDFWSARAISDSARGFRAHVVYIDNEIQDYNMMGIIRNCNTALPWNAYHYFG